MYDLIERQAAIDALGGNEPVGDPSKMDDDDVVKMWERIRIINIINKLPSAQPDSKELSPTHKALDTISRKMAIDAIEEMQMPIMRSMFPEEQFVFKGMSEALSAIKDLPSAQPEIVRCKDCEYGEQDKAEEPKKCDTCKHEKEPWSMQCHRCEDYNLWEGKQ